VVRTLPAVLEFAEAGPDPEAEGEPIFAAA
jgi:hypothetical protein